MKKISKVAVFAVVAVAALLAMGCPAATTSETKIYTKLVPVTDINGLWQDNNIAVQGFESVAGANVVFNDTGRFEGLRLNTYEAGSTIAIDNTASDGTYALHYKAKVGAGDNGFNVNTIVSNLSQTGYYKVTMKYKFLSASAVTTKLAEINIYPQTATGVAAANVDQDRNTEALPVAAATGWTTRDFYVNCQAGYNSIGMGFYQGTGATGTFDVPVEMIIDSFSISKASPNFITVGNAGTGTGITSTFDNATVLTGTPANAIGTGATEELSATNWDAGQWTLTKSAAGLRIVGLATWGPLEMYPGADKTKLLPKGTYSLIIITGAATTAGVKLNFGSGTITTTAGASTQSATGIAVGNYFPTTVSFNNGGNGANIAGTVELTSIQLIRTGN